jgi:hypothetical protein
MEGMVIEDIKLECIGMELLIFYLCLVLIRGSIFCEKKKLGAPQIIPSCEMGTQRGGTQSKVLKYIIGISGLLWRPMHRPGQVF